MQPEDKHFADAFALTPSGEYRYSIDRQYRIAVDQAWRGFLRQTNQLRAEPRPRNF